MSTPSELSRELDRERRRHQRFLLDHAPPLRSKRSTMPIRAMQWRIEEPGDRRDFTRVLRGRGAWQRVRIPHYDGPVGRAVTYYRAELELPERLRRRERLVVCFGAVDYRATVFFNSTCVATHEGFFAPFEADVSEYLKPGTNVLVVKVENDYIFMGNDDPPVDGHEGAEHQGEKLYAATGLGYDDPEHGWHHCPPGMGICQDLWIEGRAEIHISDVFVRPLPADGRAEAWIEVTNSRVTERDVEIRYSVHGQNFRATAVRETCWRPAVSQVRGAGDVPDKHAADDVPLVIKPGANLLRVSFDLGRPRMWSPATPWLYQIQVHLAVAGRVSGRVSGRVVDTARRQFGMRSFAVDEDSDPRGQLLLNGEQIRLRGANTMGNFQQDVYRKDWRRLVDDILLAKICNMNFLRFTQRPVQPEIYDYCDRLGMMTQTDLPLFGVLRRNKFAEAIRQAEEMERLVRPHPCNILISYINEAFPNARNEPHRHLLRHELDAWVEAANRAVGVLNPEQAIKPHDGDYDPPETGLPDHHCYTGWYNGHGLGIGALHRGWWQPVKEGWYYGCGEFGSEGLDPVAVMRRHYPPEWLPAPGQEAEWSPNSIIKSQTGRYHYMWFDTPATLEGWVESSGRHQAWVTDLMTQAFRRDSRMVSIAIHLFIDAFPSGWMKAIMDVDRGPKPAYFAYRNALTPLMVSLRTDRFSCLSGEKIRVEAWVCNDTSDMPVSAELVFQARRGKDLLYAGAAPADVPICSSRFQGFVDLRAPDVEDRATITVEVGLRAGTRMLHTAALEVEVYSRRREGGRGRVRAHRSVVVMGRSGGPAKGLATELGLETGSSAPSADLILVDDLLLYRKRRGEVEKAARAGATVVFLELEAGVHDLGGLEVEIRPTGMHEFYFVSRATGHMLVDGFGENDFRMWYDPEQDCIVPILGATITAEGWDAILATGIVSWGAGGGPARAAVERRVGRGAYRVCQVRLAGLLINPVARLFARRLLDLD